MERRDDFGSFDSASFGFSPIIENPSNSAELTAPADPEAPATSHVTSPLPAPPASPATAPSPARETGVSGKRGRPESYGLIGDNSDPNDPAKKSPRSVPEGSGGIHERGMKKRPLLEEPLPERPDPERPLPERVAPTNTYYPCNNFTPEIILCQAGEDVVTRIMQCAHRGDRSVCIQSGRGAISRVTLTHTNSFDDTVTYEGRFEILFFQGAFMSLPNEGPLGRAGGLNLTMSGADGQVIAGTIAGEMTATTPVTIVAGSFHLGGPQEERPRREGY